MTSLAEILLTEYTLKCTFKCMEYITTTSLRTQSSKLVQALQRGSSVSLIHRSKVIGVIEPAKAERKPFDVEGFKKAVHDFNKGRRIIPRHEREKIYRKHLEEKYGKRVS